MLETRSPASSTWEYQRRNFDSGLSTALLRDAVITCREPLAVKLGVPAVAHRATNVWESQFPCHFANFHMLALCKGEDADVMSEWHDRHCGLSRYEKATSGSLGRLELVTAPSIRHEYSSSLWRHARMASP